MEAIALENDEDSIMEGMIGERRLWTAVVVAAVQDWLSASSRTKCAAEEFLFEDDIDFYQVCASAGLDPSSVRSKLLRLGRRGSTHGAPHVIAA